LTIKTQLIHNKEIKKHVLKIYTSFYLVDVENYFDMFFADAQCMCNVVNLQCKNR